MKKYKGYYYTSRVVEVVSRNSHTPLKKYAWFIRNGKGEQMESSIGRDPKDYETMWCDKSECEHDCREAISEYYY